MTLETSGTTASCAGVTCGTGSAGNGDIHVDDTVTWSQHTLTLDAWRNIDIHTAMEGGATGSTAGLVLAYGQGSGNGVIGGKTVSYNVNAPVNLASTGSFSTKLGSAGLTIDYTILTSLGAPGSTTGTDLQGIIGKLAGHYVLGANIDASETKSWNGGAGFAPIGSSTSTAFTGTFDGLGHTVSGLTIELPTGTSIGLFGVNAGTIRDVGVIGGGVHGLVSKILGSNHDIGSNYGTIANAYATTSVSGSTNAGGLVGHNYGGTIARIFPVIHTGTGAADPSGVAGTTQQFGYAQVSSGVATPWLPQRRYARAQQPGNAPSGAVALDASNAPNALTVVCGAADGFGPSSGGGVGPCADSHGGRPGS